MGNIFGATSAPPVALPFNNEAFADAFNPEENLNNPAFASDFGAEDEYFYADYQQMPQEDPVQESQTEPPHQKETIAYQCSECGAEISESVYKYSSGKYGKPLCMKCQRGAGK